MKIKIVVKRKWINQKHTDMAKDIILRCIDLGFSYDDIKKARNSI